MFYTILLIEKYYIENKVHYTRSLNENQMNEFFDIMNTLRNDAQKIYTYAIEQALLLKEKYGDKITFWGGGVDTQRVLPFGTPDEVRKQVLDRLAMLSGGGGYVFNTIHNIVANVPVENLLAMYDAVHEFNGDK